MVGAPVEEREFIRGSGSCAIAGEGPMTSHLQAGDPGTQVVRFSPSLKASEPEEQRVQLWVQG